MSIRRIFFTFLFTAMFALSVQAQDWVMKQLEESPRHHEWVQVQSGGRAIHCFLTYPEVSHKAGVVVIIHENRGLNDWARSIADQIASLGYITIAPDLLSGKAPEGGNTPDFANSDAARTAIYELDGDQVMADLNAVADFAAALPAANGQVAVAGFCWGGSQSFRFAAARSSLKAALVFYGTGPQEVEAIERINCPVFGFYGGNDARVNATIPESEKLMKAAEKVYDPVIYEGAGHGFMRAGEQPDAAAANAQGRAHAWERLQALLAEALTDK